MKDRNNPSPKTNDALERGPDARVALFQPEKEFAYHVAGGQAEAGSACFVVELTCQPMRIGDRNAESLIFYNYNFKEGRCSGNGPASYKVGVAKNRRRAELLISAQLSGINVAHFSRATTMYIEKIGEARVYDWLWYEITFACPVQVNVRELSNPGRIILDVIGDDGTPVPVQNLQRDFTEDNVRQKKPECRQSPEHGQEFLEVNNICEANTVWTQIITEQLSETARRMAAIQNATSKPAGFENIKINEVREYLGQAKAILTRTGTWPGEDADIEIAGRMLKMGYPDLSIIRALEAASPLICGAISPLLYAEKILRMVLTPDNRERIRVFKHGLNL